MRPIWFFVGLILSAMGLIILVEGIVLYNNPPEVKTKMFSLYPNLWWSGIMICSGLIFILKNRKVKIE